MVFSFILVYFKCWGILRWAQHKLPELHELMSLLVCAAVTIAWCENPWGALNPKRSIKGTGHNNNKRETSLQTAQATRRPVKTSQGSGCSHESWAPSVSPTGHCRAWLALKADVGFAFTMEWSHTFSICAVSTRKVDMEHPPPKDHVSI